jgi:hypothetical protein
VGINGSDDNKEDGHVKNVEHLRGINNPFDADRFFMVTMIKVILLGVFFNADARSDKKEDNQRFRKSVQYAGEDHECYVIGLEYRKMKKTLYKGQAKREDRQNRKYVTRIHEKPHMQNPLKVEM